MDKEFAKRVMNFALPVFILSFIIFTSMEKSFAQQITPKVQTVVKTVKNVDATKNLLTIKLEKKTTNLSITPQTKLSDVNGKPLAFNNIKQGDKVKIAFQDNAGKLTASDVTVVLPAQLKEKGKKQNDDEAEGQGKSQGKNKGQDKNKGNGNGQGKGQGKNNQQKNT